MIIFWERIPTAAMQPRNDMEIWKAILKRMSLPARVGFYMIRQTHINIYNVLRMPTVLHNLPK